MFQEILEESLAQAMQSEHDGVATSYPELSETRRTPAMQQTVTSFDMRNAVDVSLFCCCCCGCGCCFCLIVCLFVCMCVCGGGGGGGRWEGY